MSAHSAESVDSTPHVLQHKMQDELYTLMGQARPWLDAISLSEWYMIAMVLFGALVITLLCLHWFAQCATRASLQQQHHHDVGQKSTETNGHSTTNGKSKHAKTSKHNTIATAPWYKSPALTPTILWLCISAIIHMWFELHFVFYRTTSSIYHAMNLYSAADYRYKGPVIESGTAAMETITALIVGPACLLLAYAIVTRAAYRLPLQICVCVSQMYGLLWFVLHGVFALEAVASTDPFLFWIIFVGLNMPWGVVPPILLWKAWREVQRQHAIAASVDELSSDRPQIKQH